MGWWLCISWVQSTLRSFLRKARDVSRRTWFLENAWERFEGMWQWSSPRDIFWVEGEKEDDTWRSPCTGIHWWFRPQWTWEERDWKRHTGYQSCGIGICSMLAEKSKGEWSWISWYWVLRMPPREGIQGEEITWTKTTFAGQTDQTGSL